MDMPKPSMNDLPATVMPIPQTVSARDDLVARSRLRRAFGNVPWLLDDGEATEAPLKPDPNAA